MTTAYIVALLVIGGLCYLWVRQRSERLRQEAEGRESQMLEALFAARRAAAGNGGETVDLEKAFGGKAAADRSPTSTDEVLRAAGLGADLIEMVKSPPKTDLQSVDGDAAAVEKRKSAEAPAASAGANATGTDRLPAAAAHEDEAAVPVRDLVQIFYEARGYRVVPAGRAAHPIECVLRHKSDPLRSYAFAPVAGAVTEAMGREMLDRARAIDQSRVLIAAEEKVSAALAESLLAQGVRLLDGAAIEAQLANVDFATVAKIRAVARKRAAKRADS